MKNPKKYLLAFVLVLSFLSFSSAGLFQKEKICGDGTFYDTCSSRKPYFCSEGILTEKASVCGCPENFSAVEDSCVSQYHTNPKEISLDYVLRGNENQINFVVYGGMKNYVSSLPHSIFYYSWEEPKRVDFKMQKIGEEMQREFILPLVTEIQNADEDRDDQARIAINLIQNIPFGESEEKDFLVEDYEINHSRYPYEVLYDREGICSEKAELIALILKELGYGVVLFYYSEENHEVVGIKCPVEYSLNRTGYCFVEPTGPSIITNDQNKYVGEVKLSSEPEILPISDGDSLGKIYEYRDARRLIKIDEIIEEKGKINLFRYLQLKVIRKKYGLI